MEKPEQLPPYRLVGCDFRDLLEEAAVLKRECEIVALDADEQEITLKGTIRDIWTQNGAEFLVLNGGKVLRLDRILVFNGHSNTVC